MKMITKKDMDDPTWILKFVALEILTLGIYGLIIQFNQLFVWN